MIVVSIFSHAIQYNVPTVPGGADTNFTKAVRLAIQDCFSKTRDGSIHLLFSDCYGGDRVVLVEVRASGVLPQKDQLDSLVHSLRGIFSSGNNNGQEADYTVIVSVVPVHYMTFS